MSDHQASEPTTIGPSNKHLVVSLITSVILLIISFVVIVSLHLNSNELENDILMLEQRVELLNHELNAIEDNTSIDEGDENLDSLKDGDEIEQSYYSYCHPDQDPNFTLTDEDSEFYYYTGFNEVWGVVSQADKDSKITFDSHVGPSCKFELTKDFIVDSESILTDFSIDSAWNSFTECDDELDYDPYLEGTYTVQVNGFKISKDYIDNHTVNEYLTSIDMQKFSFFVDYEKLVQVDEESRVKCPMPPI